MASELEQRLRDGFVGMTNRDFDAAMIGLAPDIEWIDPPEIPDRFEGRGADVVKRFWQERLEPFEDLVFEVVEIRESAERVFIQLRLSGRGAGSQLPGEIEWFQVGTIDGNEEIARLENFMDRASAERVFRGG